MATRRIFHIGKPPARVDIWPAWRTLDLPPPVEPSPAVLAHVAAIGGTVGLPEPYRRVLLVGPRAFGAAISAVEAYSERLRARRASPHASASPVRVKGGGAQIPEFVLNRVLEMCYFNLGKCEPLASAAAVVETTMNGSLQCYGIGNLHRGEEFNPNRTAPQFFEPYGESASAPDLAKASVGFHQIDEARSRHGIVRVSHDAFTSIVKRIGQARSALVRRASRAYFTAKSLGNLALSAVKRAP